MSLKIPGLRWYIATLLCLTTALNYLDRQALSVLAKTIQDELKLTDIDYSYITSAFLVSYTIMYAVGGRLVDRWGTRQSLLVFISGWSVANAMHGLARTALQFSVFRFILGATEAGNFPACVKACSEWFPMKERAMAVGIFNSGTAIGAALAAPIVSFIALQWGWRSAFVISGALGALWVVVWLLVYRLPRLHPWLKAEELAHIESGDTPQDRGPAPQVSVRRILATREAWGCIAARAFTDPISYFFIFWTPKFLQQERGFDLVAIGKYSGIPFVALALGNLAGGLIPGLMMRRLGWTLNRSRKTTMFFASLTMPLCLVSIIAAPGPFEAVALISMAMFAHAAWSNVTLPAEVFPKHVIASVSGFGGAMGGLIGAISQWAIGWTVQNVSFTPVFLVSSVMHLTGFTIVCLTIREIGKVREFPTQ